MKLLVRGLKAILSEIGMIKYRKVSKVENPSAYELSKYPFFTPMSPERITSQFGALVLIARARIDVVIGFVLIPNSGRPKYRKKSWTRNGVFLRNSTQAVAISRRAALFDLLMIAKASPRKNPRMRESEEMSRVINAPRKSRSE
jgi:hypothetical protein